jgi:hypothetical protein
MNEGDFVNASLKNVVFDVCTAHYCRKFIQRLEALRLNLSCCNTYRGMIFLGVGLFLQISTPKDEFKRKRSTQKLVSNRPGD